MDKQRLAALATISSRGEPHVVPVFFTYSEGKVYIHTDRSSAKVRNLLSNPNVAVAVYDGDEAVVIRGTARIVDDDEFVQRTREHIAKYRIRLDARGQDDVGVPLFDWKTRCVVEISSRQMDFW
jgi:PPOX class probable F420-dependent enzyme